MKINQRHTNIRKRTNQSGQGVVEYVLLLLVVMGFVRIIFNFLPDRLRAMERSFTESFAASYRYGDVKTKGGEDGYEYHPRAPGTTNFRMWKRMR